MSFIEMSLLGIGLAADAFAVSVTSGIAIERMKLHHAMLIAGFFGFFQALMPLIGWAVGGFARDYVSSFDHWIAFVLLSFVGGKMLYESLKNDDDKEPVNPLDIYVLFMLAIATSIDALAVGVTLSFVNVSIIEPVLIIGLITFVLSFAGTYIGKICGHLFEKKLEIAGALILIGIGIKILVEHLMGK